MSYLREGRPSNMYRPDKVAPKNGLSHHPFGWNDKVSRWKEEMRAKLKATRGGECSEAMWASGTSDEITIIENVPFPRRIVNNAWPVIFLVSET